MSDGNTVLLFQLVLDALNRCAIRRIQLSRIPAPSAKHVAISTYPMAPVPLHVPHPIFQMRPGPAVSPGSTRERVPSTHVHVHGQAHACMQSFIPACIVPRALSACSPVFCELPKRWRTNKRCLRVRLQCECGVWRDKLLR